MSATISDAALQRILDAMDRGDAKHPIYLFMDEQEKVLDCEWFDSRAKAIAHARTLDAPVVNVLLYVGCAENRDEDFHIAKDNEAA